MRLTIICMFCLAAGILAVDMDSDSLQDQYEKEQYQIRKKICLQDWEYGKCRGRRKLWYYNTQKSNCLPFIYSNCGGNGNLFYTKDSCMEYCGRYNWKKGRKSARLRIASPKSKDGN